MICCFGQRWQELSISKENPLIPRLGMNRDSFNFYWRKKEILFLILKTAFLREHFRVTKIKLNFKGAVQYETEFSRL